MKKIKLALYYVLSVHILALLFMTFQRILLLLLNLQHLQGVESKFSWTMSALLRGVWFDNVIACYISIVPLVILSVLGICNKINRPILTGFNVFYIILYTLVFAIGTADIPYFDYFFKHLNTSIFNWKEEGATNAGMILQETSYYAYFFFFLLAILFFSFLVIRLSRRLLLKHRKDILGVDYLKYAPLCLALIGLCVFGIRGRMGYNPIKTSQAYFCDNSFLNQLGINPTFFFIRDVLEVSKKHYDVDDLITEKEAIVNTRQYLGIDTIPQGSSPILREVTAEGEPKNMNVVIVLMESMSADLLNVKQNGKEITPFLNELIGKSYYFENFYSAGTHTNHGILATLYGLPSIMDRNMMKNVDIPLCEGLPYILQKQGYRTMFFMTHEAQYDNINAFLLENGVEEIYSEENYPREKRVNSFGVADDYLFEYAATKLHEKAKEDRPFLATLLTISNHPPYIVPDKFKAVSDESQYQIVAFADDAIRQFMDRAKTQDWYNNTIFVFLGDHGKIVGSQAYEMPLSYNHIPLIVYSPSFADAPKRFAQFGGQVDVFPTLMGMLNRSYDNNAFGVDLLKTERKYMFFTSDDAVGCIDSTYFYTRNFKTDMEGLFKYRNNDTQNLTASNKAVVDSMRTYSFSMLRTADYLFENGLTRSTLIK